MKKLACSLTLVFDYRDMHKVICGGKQSPGVCSKMKPVDGTTLLGYLKNVSFVGKCLYTAFDFQCSYATLYPIN